MKTKKNTGEIDKCLNQNDFTKIIPENINGLQLNSLHSYERDLMNDNIPYHYNGFDDPSGIQSKLQENYPNLSCIFDHFTERDDLYLSFINFPKEEIDVIDDIYNDVLL